MGTLTPSSTSAPAGTRPIPRLVFYGIAIASVGGPLALVGLYGPQAMGTSEATGAVALAGTAVFAVPVLIWGRYASEIAGPGGLFSFVEAAVGRRVALVEGAVWIVSYFLYLPYTIVFVVHDVLGAAFPWVDRHPGLVELGLAGAIVAGVLARERGLLAAVAIAAAAQVLVVVVFGVVVIAHAGVPASSFGPLGQVSSAPGAGSVSDSARAALAVSLFFICASLPLFLGGEVSDPHRTTRRGLGVSLAVVGACLLVGTVALPQVPHVLATSSLPGWEVAFFYAGRGLADLVAIGIAASITSLIVLEYVALARLVHAMGGVGVRRATAWIGGIFFASTVLSLFDPHRFYSDLSTPSLYALYVSQLVVFAVYPVFRWRRGRLTALDIALTVAACALMLWGLHTAPSFGGGS
jgi:amino acid transporter